jgi:hypothetical protein
MSAPLRSSQRGRRLRQRTPCGETEFSNEGMTPSPSSKAVPTLPCRRLWTGPDRSILSVVGPKSLADSADDRRRVTVVRRSEEWPEWPTAYWRPRCAGPVLLALKSQAWP